MCAGLDYWGSRQYGALIQGPWAEAFWPCFAVVMLTGMSSVAALSRGSNISPRIAFALLALSTAAVMVLYSLGRSSGSGLVESFGNGWLYAPVRLQLQLCFIGANGLFVSFLLVVNVVRRSQYHG